MTSLFVEEGSKLESTIDFSRFLKSAKKNWWKVLAFSVITTGSFVPLITKMAPKYEAYASVYLKAAETKPTLFEQVRSFDATQKEYYETQYQLIKARRVANVVVDNLKLYNNPEFYGRVKDDATLAEKKNNSVGYLLKHLTVSAVRKTQLVDVGFESENPQTAAKVANDVVRTYINFTIEDNRNASIDTSIELGKQIADLKINLAKKEANLNDFLKKEHLITFNGVDGFQTAELTLLTENLSAATAQRAHSEALYKTVTSNSNDNVSQISSIPEISRHPQMETLRIKLIDQKTELSNLEKRYGDKNEKVIQAKASLVILQQQSKALIQEIIQGIKEQYQSAVLKENQLQAAVNKMTANFQLLGQKKTQYDNYLDDINKTRKIYNQLIQRANETAVNGQFIESAASMIDPALVPLKPTKPNKKLLIAVIAIMSLLVATIFFVILAAVNNKVLAISEVKRRLGLNVLGEIRRYKKGLDAKKIIDGKVDLPSLDEAAFGIRSAIYLLGEKAQTIAISSTMAGEGASSVTALISKALAVDARVLVVDMNLRTKTLSSDLGYGDHAGITDIVYANSELNKSIIKLSNFDFIPVGNHAAVSPLVMLTNHKIKSVCAELVSDYDYVIFDAPAVDQGQDILLISQLSDAIIYVVESNKLSSPKIVDSITKLKTNRANILGCVLNKVDDRLIEASENLHLSNAKGLI
jgi:uncharacterized protein involved in exopolysaccharide biosynthesis